MEPSVEPSTIHLYVLWLDIVPHTLYVVVLLQCDGLHQQDLFGEAAHNFDINAMSNDAVPSDQHLSQDAAGMVPPAAPGSASLPLPPAAITDAEILGPYPWRRILELGRPIISAILPYQGFCTSTTAESVEKQVCRAVLYNLKILLYAILLSEPVSYTHLTLPTILLV